MTSGIRPERLLEAQREMSAIGRTSKGGLNRLTLTREDAAARRLLVRWARADRLGKPCSDEMGNLYVVRIGLDPRLPEILVGSHLDSVPSGGRFDGQVGVLAGLEALRMISRQKKNKKEEGFKHTVRLVNFTNEEGSRFQPSLLGSGVMTGFYTAGFAYKRRDEQGELFRHALIESGFKGTRSARPRDIMAYLELHIEQGPVLEQENVQIGIPTGILPLRVLEVELRGQTNHAGPAPMPTRRDALVAASKCVCAIRELALASKGDTVATVGKLSVHPGVYNAIPGRVAFTVDFRALRPESMDGLERLIRSAVERSAAEEGVGSTIKLFWRTEGARFDESLVRTIQESTDELRFSSIRLPSWAGHDAQMMCRVAPSAMIFIPCRAGLTHCEDEFAADEDIVRGAKVLARVIEKLDESGVQGRDAGPSVSRPRVVKAPMMDSGGPQT